MVIVTEWREIGVPVLYTRFSDPFDAAALEAYPEEGLALLAQRPGPFIRVLDTYDSQVPMDAISSVVRVLRHPLVRHPMRRFLVIVSSTDPGWSLIIPLLSERIPASATFLSLEKAEDFLRREGPRLMQER